MREPRGTPVLALGAAVLAGAAFGLRPAAAQVPADTAAGSLRTLAPGAWERSLLRLDWIRRGDVPWGWRTLAVALPEVAADLRLGGIASEGELRFADGNPPEVPAAVGPGHEGSLIVARGWAPLRLWHASLTVDARAEGGHLRARELSLVAPVGPFVIQAGRMRMGFGPGEGGGVVFSGTVPLDGVRGTLRSPLDIPFLGDGTGGLGIFRLDDDAPVENPWLISMRATLEPHPAVVLGLNQGIMFANTASASISVRGMLETIVRGHTNVTEADGTRINFSNNVPSVDVTVRHDLFGLPAATYLEWGFEDSAGAPRDSPGIVAGLEFAHPSRPVRFGLEWAYLSPERGHGIWYAHSRFRGGWADGGGRPLGHPLGGPGREWLLFGAAHAPDGAWDARFGLRHRHRLGSNAYAPQRAGEALGGYLDARVRVGAVQLFVDVDGERLLHDNGGGWTRAALEAEAGIRWTHGGVR